MNKILFIFLIISGNLLAQQDSLRLSDCFVKANKNYPIIKQKGLLEEISALKNKNYSANNLPSVSLNGQATYQSDVTEVNIVMPEIPGIGQIPSPEMSVPEKDQYKLSIDFSQAIWDGGISKSQKQMENASLEADLQSVEVDMYKIGSQINNLYFSVLTFNINIEIFNLLKDELSEKILIAHSTIKNGISDSSSVEIIMAEVLKLEQKIIELESGKQTSIKMLGTLLYYEIGEKTNFIVPNPSDYEIQGSRPELGFFELSRQKLDAGENLISRKNSPMVFGFGQLGYGKPGLNMLSNEFDSYYLVGAKLSWNITDIKKNSRERQILEIRKDMISIQEETFKNSLDMLFDKEMAEIVKFEKLIETSQEIFILRESIAKKSSSKFKNGVISSNDLISDLNAKTQALLNLEFYKLQLVKTKINLLTISGNLKFRNNENQE